MAVAQAPITTTVTPVAAAGRARKHLVLAVIAAAVGAGLLGVVAVASHGLVLIPVGVAVGLVAIQQYGARARAARLAPYMSEHAPHLLRGDIAALESTDSAA